MKRIMFKLVFQYFQDNILISVWQSGFIPGHLIVTHLVEIYHKFCQATSEGKEIRVVFCDVSRVFYRVWQALSWKMWHCRHPTSMAQTLLARALPKAGIKWPTVYLGVGDDDLTAISD